MHRRLFAVSVIAVLMAFAVGPVQAYIIDQSQYDGSVYMAAFSQTDLAQSFQQANNNIVGGSVLTQANVGGPDDITISLWDRLPNAGGNMLATGTATNVSAGQWAIVTWPMVNVVPNTTYYLVYTSAHNTMGLAGSVVNPYPRGMVFANPGYNAFPQFDYAFETFAIPEPATLSLLALAGVIAFRRGR